MVSQFMTQFGVPPKFKVYASFLGKLSIRSSPKVKSSGVNGTIDGGGKGSKFIERDHTWSTEV